MKKLYESKKKSAMIGTSDTKIIFTDSPYIQYEQFKLKDNFRHYIETIMSSSKDLRMGNQP